MNRIIEELILILVRALIMPLAAFIYAIFFIFLPDDEDL
jgi:hypothetical protein